MDIVKKYFGSKKSWILILSAVMIGVIIGYAWRGDDTGSGQPQASTNRLPDMIQPVDREHAALLQSELQKEETVYICPMNCVPPMEQPGRCPVCGMDLVAVAAQEHRQEEGPPRLRLAEEVVEGRKPLQKDLLEVLEQKPPNHLRLGGFCGGAEGETRTPTGAIPTGP